MTWIEIGLLWIVLSVAVPVLWGLRHTQLKQSRHRSGAWRPVRRGISGKEEIS